MLKRGKSVAYIHDYIGMPVHLIESIKNRMNPDGTLQDAGNHDRTPSRINRLNADTPIAPDYCAMLREEKKLTAINRDFVDRIKLALAA